MTTAAVDDLGSGEDPLDGIGGFAPSEAELEEFGDDDDMQFGSRPELFTRHARIGIYWALALRHYPCALAVAIMLSSYAKTEHGQRKCWPTQETLADDLHVSERAIRSALKVLRQYRFILTEKRRFQKSTIFYIDDYQPKVSQ